MFSHESVDGGDDERHGGECGMGCGVSRLRMGGRMKLKCDVWERGRVK